LKKKKSKCRKAVSIVRKIVGRL